MAEDGAKRAIEAINDDAIDERERLILGLARLMTKSGVPSQQVQEFLDVGEYALALVELVADINDDYEQT